MATEPDWLYEQALLSSRLEKYDAMEAQLKTIMTNFPRFAHAWNALGYSLAERGIRLEEARSLLTRALELAPNSPQILDSMGWLAFRSGNAAEAVTYLQRAWDTEPDAEIAAHLGEVLWSQGKQQAARAIWLQGRRLPGGTQHAVLNQTLQRLDVRVPTLYAAPVK